MGHDAGVGWCVAGVGSVGTSSDCATASLACFLFRPGPACADWVRDEPHQCRTNDDAAGLARILHALHKRLEALIGAIS